MDFPTFHQLKFHVKHVGPSHHRFHYQVLEIQRRFSHSLMFDFPHQTIHQTSSISIDNYDNYFPLPLNFFHNYYEPSSFPSYVTQLLSSLDINSVNSEVIAREIVLIANHVAKENSNASFHIVVTVDFIQFTWMHSLSLLTQQSTRNEVRMVGWKEIEKDLDDCSICLEEFSCNNRKIGLKIPCGHVYHESCILKWLENSHSCPLCRRLIFPRFEN